MTPRCRAFPLCLTALLPLGCEQPPASGPPIVFRNIEEETAYAGDDTCTACHEQEASAYESHAMARSFHPWAPEDRMEAPLPEPIRSYPTGYDYAVEQVGDEMFQVELLIGPDGESLHELRKRIDYVMGSGAVARTYFTEENGRLFQLPLTWYRDNGWDFSPGYEVNNARFDRLIPDRCIACHGSHPDRMPHLEGKYATIRPGIGCERCHGPGALHVSERSADIPMDSTVDRTIVNPEHLQFERRLDVCEQCHVHAPVTVLREGRHDFSYRPSQRLSDHAAFFKATGSIDIVSHADRLRQSTCFIQTLETDSPLECATCHNPHEPIRDADQRNEPCTTCHVLGDLADRFTSVPVRENHLGDGDCVSCHMPEVKERTVPHGTFTDHWIRVIADSSTTARPVTQAGGPIDPYYARDRTGDDGRIYRGMGQIIFATRAANARLLRAAADSLHEALRSDTARGDAQFVLGLAYRQLGRTEDAVRALELAVNADSGRPQRLHALAREYENAMGDPAVIERLYQKALALQPALAWIRASYADFLYANGRLAEAERQYRTALEERPSLDVAGFNLGTLLLGEGRRTEATAVFQDVVHLNPARAGALESLLEIRSTGNVITDVRQPPAPLGDLPVRTRGPAAVRVTIPSGSGSPVVTFVNVPPAAVVRIMEDDGTVLRTLDGETGRTVPWDLRTTNGNLITGGLRHVVVLGRDRSGRPMRPQRFSIGVVRLRDP